MHVCSTTSVYYSVYARRTVYWWSCHGSPHSHIWWPVHHTKTSWLRPLQCSYHTLRSTLHLCSWKNRNTHILLMSSVWSGDKGLGKRLCSLANHLQTDHHPLSVRADKGDLHCAESLHIGNLLWPELVTMVGKRLRARPSNSDILRVACETLHRWE